MSDLKRNYKAGPEFTNNALAEALSGFVTLKKVDDVDGGSVQSEVPSVEVLPSGDTSPRHPDVIDIDALLPDLPPPVTTPVAKKSNVQEVPLMPRTGRGNISVWSVVCPDKQKLIRRVQGLLGKNEVPLLSISRKEKGVPEASLALQLSVIENNTEVKFKVVDGKGALFESFPKNTVFFGSELACVSQVAISRQEIVCKFMVELHALMHHLYIAKCNEVKEQQKPAVS